MSNQVDPALDGFDTEGLDPETIRTALAIAKQMKKMQSTAAFNMTGLAIEAGLEFKLVITRNSKPSDGAEVNFTAGPGSSN